eukprot:g5967.t1
MQQHHVQQQQQAQIQQQQQQAQIQRQQQLQQQQAAAAAQQRPTPTNEQRQHVLRQQQQRLLLLRHASKCPAPAGQCRATPHCAAMKQLWAHIAKCKDQRCQVSHCVSSRYVLSHYHRCKDGRCAVCGPVREAIQRHHERATQLTANQNPQQTAAKTKKRGGTKRANTSVQPAVSTSSRGLDNMFTRTTQGQMKEGTSLVNTFSEHMIKRHIDVLTKRDSKALMSQAEVKARYAPVVKKLIDHKYGYIFSSPVDPAALNIPDYFTIIKEPMDLGTVKKRLDQNQYHSHTAFARDVLLTFDNAILYNEEASPVNEVAKTLKKEFEEMNAKVVADIQTNERKRRSGENACKLCGGEKLQFEPPVFYCNGTCGTRIRRNAWYYASSDNKNHWCIQCYQDAKGSLAAGEKSFTKKELKKLKHNETSEESWVQCETCARWVHMICGMFNNRFNDPNTKYHCPSCVLQKRMLGDHKFSKQPTVGGAASLPRTEMSDYLEKHLDKYLLNERRERAAAMGKQPEEVESAEGLTIRVCSVIKKTAEVKERFLARYKDKDYPAELPFHSKGMLIFQKIDGIDVIVFGMYVHEFSSESPEPNKRRVYLSYLDSVKYMEPAHMRTKVYKSVLVGYMGWIKRCGYHTCHIWACPPMKGDDYILYQKPEDQKTPKPERLRLWYIDMLEQAQERGFIHSITNLYKDCFIDNTGPDGKRPYSPMILPYFEGDYWVGLAEDSLAKMEEDKKKTDEDKGKKSTESKKKETKKKKGLKKGTRSQGPVAEVDDPTRRDELMIELGKTLEGMKDDFIVAKIRPACKNCKVTIETEAWKANLEKEYWLCDPCHASRKARKGDAVVFTKTHEAMKPTDDPDVGTEKSIEDFDTRQQFLQLCQMNHYQFDELRRAKHSSMMVLYHLHNPDAPNFVSQCHRCHKDITSGTRYHCKTCDFDLCSECRNMLIVSVVASACAWHAHARRIVCAFAAS